MQIRCYFNVQSLLTAPPTTFYEMFIQDDQVLPSNRPPSLRRGRELPCKSRAFQILPHHICLFFIDFYSFWPQNDPFSKLHYFYRIS